MDAGLSVYATIENDSECRQFLFFFFVLSFGEFQCVQDAGNRIKTYAHTLYKIHFFFCLSLIWAACSIACHLPFFILAPPEKMEYT